MPRIWRNAPHDLTCGYASCRILKGQPYQEIRLETGGRAIYLARCEQHADGPVDLEQIQQNQARFVQIQPASRAQSFTRVTESARMPFDPRLARLGEDA